jgi:hypothetical protein
MTTACFNIMQIIPHTNHIYQDTALQKAAVTLAARLCSTQPRWDVRVRLFGYLAARIGGNQIKGA